MTGELRILAAVAVVSVSLALPPATGRAETAGPTKAQAQATLREGNALLGQGRATDALMKFTEAYKLFPSPKLHYNLGQAHSLIPGHEAQAYEAMSRFLNEATDANPELRAAAEAERQRLKPKVGLVSIAADPADADLLIDDVNVGKVSPGVPRAIGLGFHRLVLKRGDAASAPNTVTIAGGETLDVHLRLVSAVAPPPVSPPAPVPPPPPVAFFPPAKRVELDTAPPPVGHWTWQRKLGAGLAGLGVASLALGIIEHVRYFGTKDDFVKAGCGTDPAFLATRADCQSLNSQFKAANTWWVIGYVGAAAFAGAGAYFLWLAPAASVNTTAAVTPGMTFNLQGRF